MEKRCIRLIVNKKEVILNLPMSVTAHDLEAKYDALRLEEVGISCVAVFELKEGKTYIIIKKPTEQSLQLQLQRLLDYNQTLAELLGNSLEPLNFSQNRRMSLKYIAALLCRSKMAP